MKRYLYFGEATVETTGEACMFAVDTFLGMTPGSASTTQMHFKSRNGAATDDIVTVTHTGHTTKAFIADKTNPTAVTNMIASVAVATEA